MSSVREFRQDNVLEHKRFRHIALYIPNSLMCVNIRPCVRSQLAAVQFQWTPAPGPHLPWQPQTNLATGKVPKTKQW